MSAARTGDSAAASAETATVVILWCLEALAARAALVKWIFGGSETFFARGGTCNAPFPSNERTIPEGLFSSKYNTGCHLHINFVVSASKPENTASSLLDRSILRKALLPTARHPAPARKCHIIEGTEEIL